MTTLTSHQRQDLIDELPRLKRYCLSLTSDPADADDLLQITVERLLEKGMPADAHVAKWSHRVCKNLWIDEIRSRDVRNRYALSEGVIDGAGTTSANTEESVQLTSLFTISSTPSILNYKLSDEELALRTVISSQHEG